MLCQETSVDFLRGLILPQQIGIDFPVKRFLMILMKNKNYDDDIYNCEAGGKLSYWDQPGSINSQQKGK